MEYELRFDLFQVGELPVEEPLHLMHHLMCGGCPHHGAPWSTMEPALHHHTPPCTTCTIYHAPPDITMWHIHAIPCQAPCPAPPHCNWPTELTFTPMLPAHLAHVPPHLAHTFRLTCASPTEVSTQAPSPFNTRWRYDVPRLGGRTPLCLCALRWVLQDTTVFVSYGVGDPQDEENYKKSVEACLWSHEALRHACAASLWSSAARMGRKYAVG